MPSKSEIGFVRSLHQKKFRHGNNLFLTEGKKTMEELLLSGYHVKTIYALGDFAEELVKRFPDKTKGKVSIVSEKELQKISTLTTAQECVAVVEIPERKIDFRLMASTVTLALDNISDPGNLGTIIRTAHWFGIETVICSEQCVEIYNPKVVQAAMGSLFFVNVIQTNLDEVFTSVKNGLPIYGTVLNGKNIYESNLKPPAIILLGNESTGIGKELKPFITHPVTIPIQVKKGKHQPDSLNVATAAAIVCAEITKTLKQ